MTEITRILAALAEANGQPAALATLVQVEGSSYRRPGARLLVLAGGKRIGSISGGCLEDDIVLRARRVLASGQAETAVYDTTSENDLVWGVGLGCQGVVRIFIEPIPVDRPAWVTTLAENLRARRDTLVAVGHDANHAGTRLADDTARGNSFFRETIPAPPALVIFGAGDDAQPLARMAKETGWHVTVADSRPAYAALARFPEADSVVGRPVGELVEHVAPDERTSVVVMTHRFADDLELLRVLLPQSLAYLGLLGPRRRSDRLLAQLREGGLVGEEAGFDRLHTPVGLDLGGDSPETVALSILAELQACRAGREPIHLRDRATPIHE